MYLWVEVYCIRLNLWEAVYKMNEKELLQVISKGVCHTTEFKESTTDITKDVYESICAFSNRDVMITNLLDNYDRMSEFAKKHLNDPFVLDGMQSVSARDAILREIISNSLVYRDYSSGYVAKMVIEKERIFADELGSGMPNTYKFSKLYSGGVPQFVEGDVFKTIIPLNETARTKKEISEHIGYKNLTYMTRTFLKLLLESNRLA